MGTVIQVAMRQIKKGRIINSILIEMKRIICSGFLCLSFLKGMTQVTIDTEKLVLNSKLHMLELLDPYEDESYFRAYLSYQPKITFLKSSGFEGEFVFYKIHAKDTAIIRNTG